MKNLRTFDQFVNESINESFSDSALDSLSSLLMTIESFGLDDPDFINEIKGELKKGIVKSSSEYERKLTPDQKKIFNDKLFSILNPLDKISDAKGLLNYIKSIKNDMGSLAAVNEGLDFKGMFQKAISAIRTAGNKLADWWSDNKRAILMKIVEIILQILLEIVFAVIRALLKSKDLKAPKVSFGGGSFGGGGSGSSW